MYPKKVGIVCDTGYVRSICMSRGHHAIKNLFTNVNIIKCKSDLQDIELLFIFDPFFIPHRNIWLNDDFINYCNLKKIKIIVFYGEKILNSVFPDAYPVFEKCLTFENLKYYVWDVDDSIKLNKKILRYCPSKYYENKIPKVEKINKCVFIGQINTNHYGERREALSKINNYIETEIIENFDGTWQDYLKFYSKYKFSFCPISGNYNGLSLRFYESLLVNCIPIQQVRKNTLSVYSTEANFKDCIFFEDIEELSEKLKKIDVQESTSKVWLEDELLKIFVEDNII